ncbi:MAG: InlB B-repeat-containing protein [Bacilli bacterium]
MNYNTAKAVSANTTYYAVTKSTSAYTATFNTNGATSVGSSSLSCYRYNGASSCNVTAPSITRSGFTIIGWNTTASATTSI